MTRISMRVDLPVPVFPMMYMCERRSDCLIPTGLRTRLKFVSAKNDTGSLGSAIHPCCRAGTKAHDVALPPTEAQDCRSRDFAMTRANASRLALASSGDTEECDTRTRYPRTTVSVGSGIGASDAM